MLAHSIEEWHQVQLMHDLGHEVFSIGAYIDPAHPLDDKRGSLDVPMIPHLKAAVDDLGQQGHANTLDAAKERLPDAVLDWADVIICHHLEQRWLIPQWPRIRDKRVIWRTVGQSGEGNERLMAPLRADGLQVVRYSPHERHIPGYIGEDALIRFWMDPDEWMGWTGEDAVVTNVTQDLYRRSLSSPTTLAEPGAQWTSWQFWEMATRDLPRRPAGPGSEAIGGTGTLPIAEMQRLLRHARAYLYTGTQPASYTLGFIEALMTGIPVVSIGPAWHRMMPYSPLLLETHEIAPLWSDVPSEATRLLRRLLEDRSYAGDISAQGRATAVELFGRESVQDAWARFLGSPQHVSVPGSDPVEVAA